MAVSNLVIKQWHCSTAPDAFGRYVEILGRKSGGWAWLMALLGVDPTVRIVVTGKEYIKEEASLGGRNYFYIPLAKIASTYHGFNRPWKKALTGFFGVFFLTLTVALIKRALGMESSSAASMGKIVFMGGVAAIIWFWLNKTMTLGVVEMGGRVHAIEFKPSLIEGVAMAKDAAEATGIIISGLIRSKN